MMTIMMMFKRGNKGSRRVLHIVPRLPAVHVGDDDDGTRERHHGRIRGYAGRGGLSHKKLSFHLSVEGRRWVMKLIIYLQRSTYAEKSV